MQVHTAHTTEDIRHVTELMEGDTWAHARKFLAAAPHDPFADHLRWLSEDGHPIACVQVFLHQYPIGCARLGMALPEYPFVPPELRGRGYFKYIMGGLFEWLAGAGYPMVYDHGRKGLYTHLGFAPCYHHCMVLIRVPDALRVEAKTRAKPATDEDIDASVDLFRAPFPLGRGLQCTDEGYRPSPRDVRVVRGRTDAGITGFAQACLGQLHPRVEADEVATVMASWAENVDAAAALLLSVAEDAQTAGLKWVRINCRRTDPLARIAVLAGGELRWHAAQERDHTEDGEDVDAFYVTSLRLAIEQLLPELKARLTRVPVVAPPALRLGMDSEDAALTLSPEPALLSDAPEESPRLELPRKAMTRAIMGYATPTELSLLHEGVAVPDECRDLADTLFPAREPHLIHEGLAFAKPPQLGLAP